MRSSSSAPSLPALGTLALGKDYGKPRSLVVPRGSERLWNCPAQAAAFSLRKYAIEVKHIPAERALAVFEDTLDPKTKGARSMTQGANTGSMPQLQDVANAKSMPRQEQAGGRNGGLPDTFSEIDLIGGNGKWRQIKAQEHFEQRRQEQEEARRQELMRAAEKKRRLAQLAERKRLHQEEEEKRWQEEREQKRRDQAERDRIKKENEEKARQQREEQEEERRRRMPKTCETCDGTGKCQDCTGKGYIFSIFLVPSHGMDDDGGRTQKDHGRVHQGCPNCGGYAHNLLGELKPGTGECPACNGLGKIWPVIDDSATPSPKSRTRTDTMVSYHAERVGEVNLNKRDSVPQ